MERIAILGGGLMGVGISQTFATSGHAVTLFEPSADVRATVAQRAVDDIRACGGDPAAARRITVTGDLAEAVREADFVTEAIPEQLALKRRVLAELEQLAPADAILASNSSVIPITLISEGLASAHRMVGTHWWNPAALIPLVEVIQGAATSAATVATTLALLRRIGKAPAHIRKDVPGFVANRLQHALWREAIAMVADGLCDAATLDDCVKNSFGLRLAVLGPLENADLVGLDLTLDIHRTIIPELDRHDGPHELLESKVADGDLGCKSGAGFQTWTQGEIAAVRRRLSDHLVRANRERAHVA